MKCERFLPPKWCGLMDVTWQWSVKYIFMCWFLIGVIGVIQFTMALSTLHFTFLVSILYIKFFGLDLIVFCYVLCIVCCVVLYCIVLCCVSCVLSSLCGVVRYSTCVVVVFCCCAVLLGDIVLDVFCNVWCLSGRFNLIKAVVVLCWQCWLLIVLCYFYKYKDCPFFTARHSQSLCCLGVVLCLSLVWIYTYVVIGGTKPPQVEMLSHRWQPARSVL